MNEQENSLPVPIEEGPKAEARQEKVKRTFWPKLRKNLTRVPFAKDAVAAFYAMRDPETPTRPKAALAAALGYFITPVDMIPDIVLGLGFSDDATVLAAVLSYVAKHVHDQHRKKAEEALSGQTDPEA